MGKRFLLVPVLAVVATLMLADLQRAEAQRRGRWGGGYGGYYGSGYYGPGYYGPGYYSYGDGVVRGGYFGDGGGYFRQSYYGGPGFVSYRNGYWDNQGYWRDGLTGGYWYTGDDGGTYFDDQGYQVMAPPRGGYARGGGCYSGGGSQARILVRLDSQDAKVWFDDHATKQKGLNRMFRTPMLEPGTHTYHVRAKWKENGRDMDETRVVRVRPGQSLTVDFTQYTVTDQTTGQEEQINTDQKKKSNNKQKQKSRQQPD